MINTNNTNNTTPALYIGTYGKYAAGSIDGAWVYMDEFDNAEEFFDYCKELHSNEENPEFMAQDFENMPKSLYSEAIDSENIEKIIEYTKLSDEEKEIIKAYDDCAGLNSYDDIKEILEDKYVGCFESWNDFVYESAENYINDCGADSKTIETLSRYFDYDQFGRDLSFDYDYIETDYNKCFVFRKY